MNDFTVRKIERVLPIIEFLLEAQNASKELHLRGRLGHAAHTEVLHTETRRTIAMLREFSLSEEEDSIRNDIEARLSGIPTIIVGEGGPDVRLN